MIPYNDPIMKNIELNTDSQGHTWSPIKVLSIAGSDSGGGAGLQADIKTISSLGGFSATAVTAITVQNTQGVKDVWSTPTPLLCQQIEAVCEDIEPDAIKISMLPQEDSAEAIASILKRYHCRNIVIDPVIVSTSGHQLVPSGCIDGLVKHLFPLADIITPNLEEVSVLTGIYPKDEDEYILCGEKLLESGSKAVILKGGHSSGKRMNDLLLVRDHQGFRSFWFGSEKIESKNLHGTGCTLSAAIAFFLADTGDIVKAAELGKKYIYQAILAGKDMKIGQGYGPVNHFFHPVATQKGKSVSHLA